MLEDIINNNVDTACEDIDKKLEAQLNNIEEPKLEETVVDQSVVESKAIVAAEDFNKPLVSQENIVRQQLTNAMQANANNAQNKSVKDLARDLTYLKGASDLQSNQQFTENYQTALGNQLLQDLQDEGKRQAIAAEAKELETRNIRNQAFYNGCEPIFALLGIDKAYGLIPMIITVVLLMLPFLAVSLIRFVINSLNSIFTSISKFTKPAFWICSIVLILAITGAGVIGLLYLVDGIFGTNIIQQVQPIVENLPVVE